MSVMPMEGFIITIIIAVVFQEVILIVVSEVLFEVLGEVALVGAVLTQVLLCGKVKTQHHAATRHKQCQEERRQERIRPHGVGLLLNHSHSRVIYMSDS